MLAVAARARLRRRQVRPPVEAPGSKEVRVAGDPPTQLAAADQGPQDLRRSTTPVAKRCTRRMRRPERATTTTIVSFERGVPAAVFAAQRPTHRRWHLRC